MKEYNVGLSQIWKAFRSQIRFLIVYVLSFLLLGVGAGFYYDTRLAASEGGSADIISNVNFSSLNMDQNYYTSCKTQLELSYNETRYYLSTLSSIASDEEEKMAVTCLQDKLEDLYNEDLLPIKDDFENALSIYIPDSARYDAITYYEQMLENTEYSIIKSKAAADLIKNGQIPAIQTDAITKTYEDILILAASYGEDKMNLAIYREILDRLQNDYDNIKLQSDRINTQLIAVSDKLNGIIDESNNMATTLAINNACQIVIEDKGRNMDNNIEISVLHTHHKLPAGEVKQIFIIFFGMFGLCSGMFIAICKGLHSKKNDVEAN